MRVTKPEEEKRTDLIRELLRRHEPRDSEGERWISGARVVVVAQPIFRVRSCI